MQGFVIQSQKGSPLRVLCLEQAEVGLPLVPDDLAAGEAADGDDHGGRDGVRGPHVAKVPEGALVVFVSARVSRDAKLRTGKF